MVKLKNAVSTGGMNIQSTKNGKGTNQVTLTGYVSIDAQDEMPMEFYHIPGLAKAIKVTSEAGATTGKTKISTNYTLRSGESYVYEVGTAAEVVYYGDTTTGWTEWDGTSDITAETGKKITVVVSRDDKAVSAGNTTVTAKA